MKKTSIALVLITGLTAMPLLAQSLPGLRVGMTRDGAVTQVERQFGRLDANGDGSFDNAEVTALLQMRASKNGTTFNPTSAERMVTSNDGNGDGKVTLDEFKTAALARFDQADTNKNGTIDPEEAPTPAAAAN